MAHGLPKESLSHHWFGKTFSESGELERHVLQRAMQRKLVSKDTREPLNR